MKTITVTQKLNNITDLFNEYLRKNSITEENIPFVKDALEKFPKIPYLIFNEGFSSPFYRVTINKRLPENDNQRISNISHLKSPPKESVTKYGRANLINQSILYATINKLTAFSEMRPEIGDLVTVSTWELPNNIKINVVPVFIMTSGNGGLTHNSLSLDYLSSYYNIMKKEPKEHQDFMECYAEFLSKCFAKDVEATNHYDYFISAFFADRLFRLKNENIEAEAILYPSVRQDLGFSNIAIKPESFSKFKLLKVEESCIIRTKPGYFMDVLKTTENFDLKNDLILW